MKIQTAARAFFFPPAPVHLVHLDLRGRKLPNLLVVEAFGPFPPLAPRSAGPSAGPPRRCRPSPRRCCPTSGTSRFGPPSPPGASSTPAATLEAPRTASGRLGRLAAEAVCPCPSARPPADSPPRTSGSAGSRGWDMRTWTGLAVTLGRRPPVGQALPLSPCPYDPLLSGQEITQKGASRASRGRSSAKITRSYRDSGKAINAKFDR